MHNDDNNEIYNTKNRRAQIQSCRRTTTTEPSVCLIKKIVIKIKHILLFLKIDYVLIEAALLTGKIV